MKEIILRRSRYKKLPETVFSFVVFLIFAAFILFDVLSGENRISTGELIGASSIFLVGLIFFSWQIFSKKKQSDYININGWQYRLFSNSSKWKFICISGAFSSIRIGLIMALLYMGDFINNDFSVLEIILIALGCCVVSTVPYGYINYKIYADVEMETE